MPILIALSALCAIGLLIWYIVILLKGDAQ